MNFSKIRFFLDVPLRDMMIFMMRYSPYNVRLKFFPFFLLFFFPIFAPLYNNIRRSPFTLSESNLQSFTQIYRCDEAFGFFRVNGMLHLVVILQWRHYRRSIVKYCRIGRGSYCAGSGSECESQNLEIASLWRSRYTYDRPG